MMNSQGDFRYVTEDALNFFGGQEKRFELFKPGGKLGKVLACHFQSILRIDNWIFVHGGLLHKHLKKFTLTKINKLVRDLLLNKIKIEDLNNDEKDLLINGESIFWDRSLASSQFNCNNIYKTLKVLKSYSGGIVIGHTPHNSIESNCKNKIWKIDNKLSKAFDLDNKIEILEIKNNKQEIWDIHLKGAGPTRFARGFDGRATLNSSIREHLASEALNGLGIPTTRSLAVIGIRELIYRQRPELAAILVRVADSHIRFGSFEFFHYTGQEKNVDRLLEFSIQIFLAHRCGTHDS